MFWRGCGNGKNISYSYLRVFGCRASIKTPRDELFKLDGMFKQCIFLGYGNGDFGYKF